MTDGNASAAPHARPDPPRVAWRKEMRERVIAEARSLAAEDGWDRVRVADLALRAGVSRPSIYKEFGDRAGIGRALVEHETDKFLIGLAAVLDTHRGRLAPALEAAVAHSLEQAAVNPFVGAVLTATRGGTDALLPFLTSRPEPVFSSTRRLLCAWFGETVPQVTEDRRAAAADLTVRLTLSHMLLPSHDPGATPSHIARTVCATLGA
ncbi:TetR family transcriptional regulator [Streptomyces populi]|uniref:TetR family transcriptional regulator n=1 Tax=Streptomyces populi TaxID=2058924 RepID=A0A2I0SKF1_9ACTN|nr:TetR family transcriptional regulator [Streptomyces populi]PKT70423.1 TetR family transcriptional regulator [Streptomyces populi]